MKTALFIILPYASHYNACFGLAHEFQCRGFRVVFTGSAHLADHITRQGYEFCSMEYAYEYNIRTIRGWVAFFLRSLLDRRDVARRYRVWYRSMVGVRQVYERYRPQQVFIDAHLSHYYLFLKDYSTSITVVSVELSMKKSFGLPPSNSFYVPTDSCLSILVSEMLWMMHAMRVAGKNIKNRVAFLNRNEIYFQKRLCQRYGIRWADTFETSTVAFIGLKDVPTIILGSEELEFPQREKLPDEQYLFLPIQRNEESYFSDAYLCTRKKIRGLKDTSNYHIIYCSFGTLSGLNLKSASAFVDKLIKIIKAEEKLLLLLSFPYMEAMIDTADERIFLAASGTQLDILCYCDMMITHGGHNSVKECLQARVPMLVYPLNRRVDQPGNAARVYARGYGLMGNIDKDTPETILKKIQAVLRMKYEAEPPSYQNELAQYFYV